MAKKVKYTGKISDEELKKLKEQYKTVYVLEVPANDEGSEIGVAYLKPIDRPLMSAVLAVNDKVQRKEMILTACWISGDEKIKTDDEMFFSSMSVLDNMLFVRAAELKKN